MSEPPSPSDNSESESGMGTLRAWEQRPDEGPPAYTAFCRFLYMAPADRSLAAAYRQETGKNQASPSGQWTDWYTRFQWRARARAYDRYRAAQHRERLEREQLAALAAFASQQHKLNAAATEAAVLLMRTATAALQHIDPEDLAKKPGTVAMFIRTAAAAATTASDAQARALGVDELLGKLDDGEQESASSDEYEDEGPEEGD